MKKTVYIVVAECSTIHEFKTWPVAVFRKAKNAIDYKKKAELEANKIIDDIYNYIEEYLVKNKLILNNQNIKRNFLEDYLSGRVYDLGNLKDCKSNYSTENTFSLNIYDPNMFEYGSYSYRVYRREIKDIAWMF